MSGNPQGNAPKGKYPTYMEMMAKYHYEQTDANASTIPWTEVLPAKRDLLIKIMTRIVDRVLKAE